MIDESSPKQDALAIAKMTCLDAASLTHSSIAAELAVAKMVLAEVVTSYTLIDQLLTETITTYFLGVEPISSRFESQLSDQERIFTHHLMDEMYLLKKLAIVHVIQAVPSEITKLIQKVNAVRNALAHSFRPENRKEYRATGQVMYDDNNIHTPAGLQKFMENMSQITSYLHKRAYGPALGQ